MNIEYINNSTLKKAEESKTTWYLSVCLKMYFYTCLCCKDLLHFLHEYKWSGTTELCCKKPHLNARSNDWMHFITVLWVQYNEIIVRKIVIHWTYTSFTVPLQISANEQCNFFPSFKCRLLFADYDIVAYSIIRMRSYTLSIHNRMYNPWVKHSAESTFSSFALQNSLSHAWGTFVRRDGFTCEFYITEKGEMKNVRVLPFFFQPSY